MLKNVDIIQKSLKTAIYIYGFLVPIPILLFTDIIKCTRYITSIVEPCATSRSSRPVDRCTSSGYCHRFLPVSSFPTTLITTGSKGSSDPTPPLESDLRESKGLCAHQIRLINLSSYFLLAGHDPMLQVVDAIHKN